MKLSCLLVTILLAGGEAFAQLAHPPLSRFANAGAGSAVALDTDTPRPTFRGGIDLVALSVVVTDADQNFVTGLTADDFTILEDGVPQDVSFFADGDVPLDLAILLDTSASMNGRLGTAQQAAIGFATTLGARDRLLVVDIKDALRVLAPLGTDLSAAKEAILATRPQGATALYNGLYLTLNEMAKAGRESREVRRQAIVVLSDGDDTASLIGFEDVMALAKRSGIAVYTITLQAPWTTPQVTRAAQETFSQAQFSMRALARETGGRSFFPAQIGELTGVYGVIADEFAHQYALGYTSNNPRQDGAYRRVAVRVTHPEGVRARTRAGYIAAKQ